MNRLFLCAVAVAGMVSSASATTWFDVTSASGQNGSGNTPFTTPQTLTSQDLGSNILAFGNGNAGATLSQAQFNDLNTLLSGVLAGDTLTYFAFTQLNGTGNPRGYFGIAYHNATGGDQTFSFSLGGSNNTEGVFSGTGDVGGVSAFGAYNAPTRSFSTSNATVAAGDTFFVVYGGFTPNGSMSGAVTDTGAETYAISYLSWDGANYQAYTPAGSYYTSNLNVATYHVPVPAPALLAGAGLVGAAALRRRMAKKA